MSVREAIIFLGVLLFSVAIIAIVLLVDRPHPSIGMFGLLGTMIAITIGRITASKEDFTRNPRHLFWFFAISILLLVLQLALIIMIWQRSPGRP